MNVKIFRLNSGEEIISRFETTEKGVKFKDPAILVPVGQGKIGLMPWMIYSKAAAGIEIPNSFIAFTVDALDELKTQYDSSLNTGLVTPSAPIKGNSKLKLATE